MTEEIDREVVKKWLKSRGYNREWLAYQCGVSKGTVNNWLSAGRPIKGAPARIIEGLMDGARREIEIRPKLEVQTYKKLTALAKEKGITIEELISEIIKEALLQKAGMIGGRNST